MSSQPFSQAARLEAGMDACYLGNGAALNKQVRRHGDDARR